MLPTLVQDLLDTNQYVRSELLALDKEQRQIDERAAHVEWQLRNAMDRGALQCVVELVCKCLTESL